MINEDDTAPDTFVERIPLETEDDPQFQAFIHGYVRAQLTIRRFKGELLPGPPHRYRTQIDKQIDTVTYSWPVTRGFRAQ